MSSRINPPFLALALFLLAETAFPLAATTQSWESADGEKIDLRNKRTEFTPDATPQEDARRTFAALDEVDWTGWESLAQLLTDVHTRAGIPALAAAFVHDGKIAAQATVGVDAFGTEDRVRATDRFHLGSVTKSFTAVVVAKLVEDGQLAWSTTVGEVLGDEPMRDAYRDVTIEELLHHRGGLPSYTDGRPAGHDRSLTYSGTPTEKRAAFLADALQQPPVGTPGRTFLYSNAGYALAGHMAERITGVSWEELVRRHVFGPLHMTTAGFGFPERPLGHAGNGPAFLPVPLSAYPPMEIIAPAGNIHGSVADLARYALAHLAGLGGADGFLRSETVKRLHTVPRDETGAIEMGYAGGWRVREAANGERIHSHGGTVGASFAKIELYPATGSGVIVLTTVSQGVGEMIASQVARSLLARFRRPTSGFVRASGTSSPIDMVQGESTEEEDARAWSVVRRLSEAINNEDREAYRALFSPDYDSYDPDSMFDFMARNVLPMRGGVRSFHALSPPLLVAGSDVPMRAVTFHLENGYPGYFGISLNERGELVELSLFVKGDMCPNGSDRHCAKSVRVLGEDFE